MIAGALKPVGPATWLAVPTVLCILASAILAAPLRIFGLQAPEPVFAFAPAFVWGLARPSVAPPLALLVMGLFLDLLWGGPLGLWPVCLLCAYAPVLWARPILAGMGFWALWAWYAGACALAFGAGFLMVTIKAGVMPTMVGIFWQFVVSAALFPFAWRLFERYEAADGRFR